MRKILLFIIASFFASTFINGQDKNPFKYFAHPRTSISQAGDSTFLDVKPIVTIPALKIVSSVRSNALYDAEFITSAGGGITIQSSTFRKDGTNYVNISLTPVGFILTGNTTQANSVIDLSYFASIGLFNNVFQIGGGYDLGAETGKSRFFWALSFGINLSNNK
jgi:hypothetical protein